MNQSFTETEIILCENMTMNFSETPEFQKDFKRLYRRYKTLPDDLKELKRVLTVFPTGNGRHFHVLKREKGVVIIKARFFCRALKGSSLRIIYAYHEDHARVEFVGIEFIEVYYKGDTENEDRERILRYVRNVVSI